MSETKEIILTGDAVNSSNKKRRSRKSLKGGGSTQAGTITQLHSTSSSTDNSTATAQGIIPSKIAEVSASVCAPTTFLKEQVAGAQQKITKVILKAPKKKTQKVVLSFSKTVEVPKHHLKSHTRKPSKRIQFSLKNLRTKLHKAKTIKKNSEEKSLDEIKKILTEAKLIKTDSKAPEAMIRQIYNDFMTMKHKAL